MSALAAYVPRGRRGHRDGNHTRIVQALRAAGRSVVELHGVGGGCPDLLVGWGQAHMLLMEIKDPAGRDTVEPSQRRFAREWRGLPVVVVRSVDQALAATGIPRPGAVTRVQAASLAGVLPSRG